MCKKRLIALGLALCLLLAGCGAEQEQPEPSSPESSSLSPEEPEEQPELPVRDTAGWSEGMVQLVERVSRNYIEQRDKVCEGELTGEDVARVWYLVNTIYDADDIAFADETAEPPEGVPAGILSRFVDFDEATRYLFTDHGMEQLLSAEMAGAPYIYKAENGEVYHRGPYKTGYAYQNTMTGYRVISSDGDSVRIEVSRKIMAPLDWEKERPETYTTLYLKREDGRWKVDSYNFPDASYPEEFTITEELRVTLTAGEKETALSDADAKEQVMARLQELTLGSVVREAPPEDCIAIQAIGDGAFYCMSVAPDGRVWDTLYAEEDWILYQADPAFYQELQELLA